jgi:hypothetical protein
MRTTHLALVALAMVAACDPVWTANVRVRDPSRAPIREAAVWVACPDGRHITRGVKTGTSGEARVSRLGRGFPQGCDLTIAKDGYAQRRLSYAEICPRGPEQCPYTLDLEVVLAPPGEAGDENIEGGEGEIRSEH